MNLKIINYTNNFKENSYKNRCLIKKKCIYDDYCKYCKIDKHQLIKKYKMHINKKNSYSNMNVHSPGKFEFGKEKKKLSHHSYI